MPSCGPEATDIEGALRKLAARRRSGGSGPVVLVTDGWENRGDARNAANALLAARSQLYIFTPPGAGAVANVAMTELNLPHALSSVEPFALGVTMLNMNDTPAKGTIKIFENEREVEQREVTLASGRQTDRFSGAKRQRRAGLLPGKFSGRRPDAGRLSGGRFAPGMDRHRGATQGFDPD